MESRRDSLSSFPSVTTKLFKSVKLCFREKLLVMSCLSTGRPCLRQIKFEVVKAL